MKIHEQEWKVRSTNIGPIIDDVSRHSEGEAVCMVYAPMSYEGRRLTLEQSDAIKDERARFIEAAPKMARALLDQGVVRDGQWHTRECWEAERGCIVGCQGAVFALRSAGVL